MVKRPLLVGAPVRSREWALGAWWECLREALACVDRPRIEVVLLLNGPHRDGTEAKAEEVAEAARKAGFEPTLLRFETEGPEDLRWGRERAGVYRHLARCRERLRSVAIERGADLLSIDSDVMIPPGFVRALEAEQGTFKFVAGLLSNSLSGTFAAPNAVDILVDASGRPAWAFLPPVGFGARIVTGFTGAAFLASLDFLKAATYMAELEKELPPELTEDPAFLGEDLALAHSARKAGFQQALHEKARAIHCMDRNRLQELEGVRADRACSLGEAVEALAVHQWAADAQRGLVGPQAWEIARAEVRIMRRCDLNQRLQQQCVPWPRRGGS